MKIDLSKDHKEKILYFINNYQNISNEQHEIYDKLKLLQNKLNESTIKLQSIRDEEKEYMNELHKIYGDFTLNDLYDSLYILGHK